MNKRAVILATTILCGFAFVVMRLADLMLINHERLAAQARLQHLGKKEIGLRRGAIVDRRGRPLAVNVDVESAFFNPREADDPAKAVPVIAEAASLDRAALARKLSSDKGFVWVERKLSPQKAERLRSLKVKGLGFVPELKRVYPKGPMAAHVVGSVGIDNQPLEGLELAYNKHLKGKPASVLFEKDAGGRPLSDGEDYETGGNSLVLTIDEGLQFIVEKALDNAVTRWEAPAATAIMMNPFTGEILALANRPAYDPNDPSSSTAADRRNRAITDLYEPGSTFKLVMAAGAIEEKVVKPGDTFDASKGYIVVGRRAIWDVHNHGVLTFKEVIQASSNVGAIMVGERLGKEKLYEYAKRFGFGEKTGIDLPGESSGTLKPLKQWSGTTLAAMSIGYEVAVTPLQVLRAYSAVANGGYLVEPYVVSRIISPEGQTIWSHRSDLMVRAISERTAETLKDMLVSVTEKGGTASEASIDGNSVAGKTGTAKLIDRESGGYSKKKYMSSFVGFVPADDPRVAVIVVVREPKGRYYGGLVAAPVFREIADRTMAYLGVPREDSFKENVLVVGARELR
ncbi:MAG: penicillin-binding protein 2 [Thermodesulfovibrionales bacterium]